MTIAQPYRKKLIEVALPLDAINIASAREKSIRHGHPSALHLWWARRPLAACRAVLFAQLVDDPSAHPDQFPTEETQDAERQRLFEIIEDLVTWENSTNLMGVCWHHHHLLHEGGWDASGDADSEIVVTSPYGRTLRSRAGPIAA